MARLVSDERGSALMLAAIAMLVLGVLSISFALLADMETKIGVSYKQQAQAEAMAEVGLEMARDAVRLAPAGTKGFTRWFDGTLATHVLFNSAPLFTAGHPLAAARFSARIDNDCPAANPGPPSWFPTSIKEPDHGATACDNTTDYNEVAVITAWAQSGTGRSRVRAIVAVDNPWKHVCSDAKPDNNGYCNDALNRNGNPTVTPADPNDPNGPQGYKNLPLPVLGCSRIAPELHRGPYAILTQRNLCRNTYPAMYTLPYPVAFNVAPRFVLMGEDPTNPNAQNPKTCNNEPAGGNNRQYFGYFDCALTTYCHAVDGHVCAGLPDLQQDAAANTFRTGCLPGERYRQFYGLPASARDTRVVAGHINQTTLNPGFTNAAFPPPVGQPERWSEYDPASGTCVHGNPGWLAQPIVLPPNPPVLPLGSPAQARPGLVLFSGGPYNYASGGTVSFSDDVGSQTRQFDVYVFHAAWNGPNNKSFYGTLAVETNSNNPACPVSGPCTVQFQVGNGASTKLFAGANSDPPAAGWANPTTAPPGSYGYPIVALVYDPFEAPPTITPTYAPQPYTMDMGSNNTEIHGMIYSGGHVMFNPLSLDGTVVGYEIQTQGSATYTYNGWYGDNTPPAGFPTGSADAVVIIRKSFIVCVNYSDDTGTPTGCN